MFVAHSARRCAAARLRWGALGVLLATFALAGPKALAAEIALTIQSNGQGTGGLFSRALRAQKIVRSLEQAGVARVLVFFHSAIPHAQDLRALYAASGHIVGNHTHLRLDLDRASSAAFWDDVLAGHRSVVGTPGFVSWFRYPNFHEGADEARRDRLRAELATMGYRNAYVTIDHRDEYLDALLQAAVRQKQTVDRAALRTVYLDVMLASVEFYDRLAAATLGRPVRHVIALHDNDLNALFLGDLVTALRELGHVIIAPERAYEDEIAGHLSPNVYSRNPGRIVEIARDRGYSGPLWHASFATTYIDALFKSRRVVVASTAAKSQLGPPLARKSPPKESSSRRL